MRLPLSTMLSRPPGRSGRVKRGFGATVLGKVPAIGFHTCLGIVETRVLAVNADPVFEDRTLAILGEIEGLEVQIVRNLSEAVQALLEENFDGLRVENATVAIRDSVAAENSDVGFFAFASQAGSTADLSANNCQATHNTDGFFAGSGAGTAQLAVSNSVASLNIGYGVGVGNNGTVRASSNIVIRNSNGFVQNGSGVFRSRANNTVDGNTTADTNGTITTFGST